MTFLNPAILIGLTAIAIPILIHLLNLRKIRKVEFSTLMFLKEIQKSKMRRIKLKQILLLLLRIFAIIFLVLSFSRPVYEGFAGNQDAASKSTSLIFIDNSFSMDARDNDGLYLNQAKESVKKILDAHKESDDIYLIPFSNIPFKDEKYLFDNFKELLDSLDNTKIGYKLSSVNEALSLSDKILNESKNSKKEIFIISDFQKNNFGSDMALSNDFKNIQDNSVSTYLIKIGERTVNNLSLDSLIFVSKIIEKDRDVKLKIFLNNHSQFDLRNKTINLYIENELKGEKAVDVNSFEKKEIEFSFKPDKSGSISGVIELAQSEFKDDELIQDNKYYFTLYIPGRFNIGFIEENSSDFKFLDLAFQTVSKILSDSVNRRSELFNINYESSINENIFRNNVLFISNKKSFTDAEADILKNYISGGGGTFFFLGKDIDVNNYNNTIFNKINPLRIDKINIDMAVNENLKFDKVDFEHPVLSEVFQNQKLNITADKFNIESPKINSYYELLINDNSNSIITLNNNKPFLVESKLSKGKIIICSVPATNDLSDFPLKSIFVPLIIRSVYYLGNDFDFQKEYIVGNSNLISAREIKNVSSITLPDKSQVSLNIDLTNSSDNYLLLQYSKLTSQVGNYTLEDSSGVKFSFAINYNSKESSPDNINKDELVKYFAGIGIKNAKVIGTDENISEAINESNTGIGLWKYFLIVAILFILSELFLSKKLEES
ncbi:MAG: BatA domain-containing protein [Bacteroidota bacterium]|nr:BatA domain-containing protein [Bacteroidota bacterium]